MKKEGFDFFQNRACEYFPCHKGVADEDFNCLFCIVLLYLLGESAEAILSICQMVLKIVPTARCPIAEKDMHM